MKKLFIMILSLFLIMAMVAMPAFAEAIAEPGEGFRIDLTPVFQAIIAFLAALVTYKIIPWLKSKTTAQQQANLNAAIKVAVFAAEQLYGALNGQQKMDYVQAHLQEHGYVIDTAAIEAAVRQLTIDQKAAKALPAAKCVTKPPD